MKVYSFPDGLTVRELKQLLDEWPDVDDTGDQAEVWVRDSEGTITQVREVMPLGLNADLLLQHGNAQKSFWPTDGKE